MNKVLSVFFMAAFILVEPVPTSASTLMVGPGKRFARIEDANAKAKPGDVIRVYPRLDNAPYEKVAVFVRQKNLTFKAVPSRANKRVIISGKGFEYSGRGSIPRALFQFNKGADNCTLEGFELRDANNKSHNGAGVRINQANNITIRNCEIHHNNMGIMSNGNGTDQTAINQVIENCVIHHNGSYKKPGYSHNLYLGGTSATIRFCDIHHSLTGHNVKSRAHYTRVLYSYIHDSSNREIDLVDSTDTESRKSDAVLMGNIVVKDSECEGNRAVIHFGQDGKREHDGTIYLIHNTIITQFISPVIDISAGKAKGVLIGNFVCDGGTSQSGQTVVGARKPGKLANVSGTKNWFDRGFSPQKETALSAEDNDFGQHIASPFVKHRARDYRPAKLLKRGVSVKEIRYSQCPGAPDHSELPLAWEYVHPAGARKRRMDKYPTLGAYERK